MKAAPRHPYRAFAIALTLLVLVGGVSAPPASAAGAPSLRLLAAQDRVPLGAHKGRVFLYDLGVWAEAVGGAFELRVTRPDYEAFQATQVDPHTIDVLRSIPADLLDGWHGLSNFTHVVFRDRAGDVVARKSFTFCPNSWDRQRVVDAGPQVSLYPYDCGGYFPFTRGMVWGIDDHWAVSSFSGAYPSMRIPDGTYQVTVRIAKTYAGLFDVPAADRSATVTVTVKSLSTSGTTTRAPTDQEPIPGREADVPTLTSPDPTTVPDLVALPLWSIRAVARKDRDLLQFAATPWNSGPSPLVVEGFRRQNSDVMDAYQYFYDVDGNVVGRAPAGTMKFDDRRGHHHWHFLQFARYTMLDLSRQVVVRSHKQSYCIFPTDAVDLTVPRATWNPWNLNLHSACGGPGSIWIREELDTGWGDTYYQSVAGQAFEITRVPNGWYYLRSVVNPLGKLYEASADNNVVDRLVHLSGKRGHRHVLVEPWHGIEG